MKKPNEQHAIDSVIQILPDITGETYCLDTSPDESNSHDRDVDYVLRPKHNGIPLLAVEHTILQAFREQITYGNRSFDIVQRVNERCKGELPQDRFFMLVVSPALVDRLRKQAIDTFVDKISKEVVGQTSKLDATDYATLEYDSEKIFVICGGSHPDHNGSIGRIAGSPKNREELMLQSLLIAIDHGIGKFIKYKETGCNTLLVLEDISGEFHASLLKSEGISDAQRLSLSKFIDYILTFVSLKDEMIVANVWKENDTWYEVTPIERRYSQKDGQWTPLLRSSH